MKTISLRSGIITMIIILIVSTIVHIFGPVVCDSIVQKGFAMDIVAPYYGHICFGIRVINSLGLIVLGILMAQIDRNHTLSIWGGRLMAIGGVISLVYAIIVFISLNTSIFLASAPVRATFIIIENVLWWSALIMIACYYNKNDFIRFAIIYVVIGLIINGHYVWSLLTQENYHSNYVMGCFKSLIGLTLILIYFFKWLKFTQTELPPMPK
jgi:hypothetical protein